LQKNPWLNDSPRSPAGSTNGLKTVPVIIFASCLKFPAFTGTLYARFAQRLESN
jgi:hypothetical protein